MHITYNQCTGEVEATHNTWSDAARAAARLVRRTGRLGQAQGIVSKLGHTQMDKFGGGLGKVKKALKAQRIKSKAMSRYLKGEAR